MKRKLIILSVMLVLAMAMSIVGCGNGQSSAPDVNNEPEVKLTIAAAASLVDALNELETMYKEEKPNVTLTYNLAASGTLQKQIEEGAPADLFISAGKSQMDALVEKELIVEDSLMNLLGNELVLIANKDSAMTSFDDLTTDAVQKISIGTPETVPAGKYAQETLTTMNLWDQIQSKIVMANDVRQVLTYVETGDVDAGLVYSSDATQGQNIKVVAAAPAGSSKPIVYPMAIIADSKNIEAAADFEEFLISDKAMQVFVKYGFKDLK